MNMLMTIDNTATQEANAVFQKFKDVFPPTDPSVRIAVPVCRLQKCHDSKKMKLFIKLQRVPPKLAEVDKNLVEDAIIATLSAMGGERLVGQAPRGALERRAQELLSLLGESSTPAGDGQPL